MSETADEASSIYQQWGVRTVINACGAVTRLGGAPMPPAVLQAFVEAANTAVSLEELQAAASREIARVTQTEAGLVTAGSAAALTMGAAAIIAGRDLNRIERLPHCEGFPAEFIIAREQRSGYDHAVRAAGARLVEVGFNEIVANAGVRRTEVWEYEAAIGPQTAGIVYVYSPNSCPRLEDVVACAHRRNLPVLVDAAGELPPKENLHLIPAMGADLVGFSGGKSIRGPQSTGILCGRRELVGAAALQMLDMDDHYDLWEPPVEFVEKSKLAGIPRHGLGRGMKVSKEEVAALLTALKLFSAGAYDIELAGYRQSLQAIAKAITTTGVTCEILDKDDGQTIPTLMITINPAEVGREAVEICRSLRIGSPGVFVGHGRLSHQQLVINPLCVRADQVEFLTQRLKQELTKS